MSGRTDFQVLRERLAERLQGDPAAQAHFEEAHRAMRDALALAEAGDPRALTQMDLTRVIDVSNASISQIDREDDI